MTVIVLAVLAVTIMPSWIVEMDGDPSVLSPKDLLEAKNAARGTLLQALAAVFFIGTATLRWRQLRGAREGQITDRYSSAVDKLASDQGVDVQVGGLYALGRIAMDSPPDRATVSNVVAHFLRRASPWVQAPHETHVRPQHTGQRRLRDRAPTAQVALDVLCEGIPAFRNPTARRLNRTFVDLRNANLGHAHFPVPPDLEGSNLARAFLDGADLRRARLDRATLVDTALAGADLREAEVRDARICTNLARTDLSRAQLHGSDVGQARNIERAVFRGARADATTRWPAGFDPASHGVVLDS